MFSVGIIDVCPIFRHGLSSILSDEGFQVADVGPGPPASLLGTMAVLHVILASLEALHGVRMERRIEDLTGIAPLLLIVPSTDVRQAEQYLRSGVAGVVDRCAPGSTVVESIRSVAAGGEPPSAPQPDTLSPREAEVLAQIAGGRTHGQIARSLGISPHTVDTYVKRIRSKGRLGNKAELTRAAVLGGFTTIG